MVSKSTKRKHRRNRAVLAARASVELRLIDRRCDFWLISRPSPQPGHPYWTCHVEVHGRSRALRVYATFLSHTLRLQGK